MPVNNLNSNFVGYKPEWRRTDRKSKSGWTEWEPIELKLTPDRGLGVPWPLINGGFLREAWLCGKSQAWALAWGFVAGLESTSYANVEVRIIEYKVTARIETEIVPAPNETRDAEGTVGATVPAGPFLGRGRD